MKTTNCICKVALFAASISIISCSDSNDDPAEIENDVINGDVDQNLSDPLDDGIQGEKPTEDTESPEGLPDNSALIEIEDHWAPFLVRDKQIKLYPSITEFNEEVSSSGAVVTSAFPPPGDNIFLTATTGFLPQVGDYINLSSVVTNNGIASVSFESSIYCGEDDSPSTWTVFEGVPIEDVDFVSVKESPVLCESLSDEIEIPGDVKQLEAKELASGGVALSSPNNKLLRVISPISDADAISELLEVFDSFNIPSPEGLEVEQNNELVFAVIIGHQQLNVESVELHSINRVGSSYFDFIDSYGVGYLEINIDIRESCSETLSDVNTQYLIVSVPKTEWSLLTLFNENVIRCME